jgi:hypothetical protein
MPTLQFEISAGAGGTGKYHHSNITGEKATYGHERCPLLPRIDARQKTIGEVPKKRE